MLGSHRGDKAWLSLLPNGPLKSPSVGLDGMSVEAPDERGIVGDVTRGARDFIGFETTRASRIPEKASRSLLRSAASGDEKQLHDEMAELANTGPARAATSGRRCRQRDRRFPGSRPLRNRVRHQGPRRPDPGCHRSAGDGGDAGRRYRAPGRGAISRHECSRRLRGWVRHDHSRPARLHRKP